MLKRINQFLLLLILVAMLVLIATQARISRVWLPPTAQVYVDRLGVYASPPCVAGGKTEHPYAVIVGRLGPADRVLEAAPGVVRRPLAEVQHAYGAKSRPDSVCVNAGGLDQQVTIWQSLTGAGSRWMEDGTWRW